MCGITGVIGRSKNKEVTYQLLTRLFANCESRGKDASGFWGTEINDGRILYHKEPEKSSDFVKGDMWKKVQKINFDLMIAHARGTSSGVGGAYCNKNNHPFSSSDRSIGIIHNGRIPDSEYDVLKKQWELFSNCDSEIVLRIMESGELYSPEDLKKIHPNLDIRLASRLAAIRDIYRLANKAHMAIAVGERGKSEDKSERNLWLFRNKYRPIWVADLRDVLGQLFFVSTPEIWHNSVMQTPSINKLINKSIKLSEIPPEEIWMFKINSQTKVVETKEVLKYYVEIGNENETWEPTSNKIGIRQENPIAEVFTNLDDKEDLIKTYSKPNPTTVAAGNSTNVYTPTKSTSVATNGSAKKDTIPLGDRSSTYNKTKNNQAFSDDVYFSVKENSEEGQMYMKSINKKVDSIKRKLDKVTSMVFDDTDGNVSEHSCSELNYSLEQIELEMDATIKILEVEDVSVN